MNFIRMIVKDESFNSLKDISEPLTKDVIISFSIFKQLYIQ